MTPKQSAHEVIKQIDEKSRDVCWIWAGHCNPSGYPGTITIGSRTDNSRRPITPYRLMYEATYGPVPKELELDHLCRERMCINPDHLEAVTHLQNMRRSLPYRDFSKYGLHEIAKTECLRGHPFNETNTYRGRREAITPGRGWYRKCRACGRERALRRYHERTHSA